jgi:hypothetical protein
LKFRGVGGIATLSDSGKQQTCPDFGRSPARFRGHQVFTPPKFKSIAYFLHALLVRRSSIVTGCIYRNYTLNIVAVFAAANQ